MRLIFDPRTIAVAGLHSVSLIGVNRDPGYMWVSAQREKRTESKLQRGPVTVNGVESVKYEIEVTKEEWR
jgi:hypothetical protein